MLILFLFNDGASYLAFDLVVLIRTKGTLFSRKFVLFIFEINPTLLNICIKFMFSKDKFAL